MLILFGCYWLSMWIVVPIAILHGRITSDIIYSGTLGALLMYIVAAIPVAIVAVGAGALCVYSIEGAQHKAVEAATQKIHADSLAVEVDELLIGERADDLSVYHPCHLSSLDID